MKNTFFERINLVYKNIYQYKGDMLSGKLNIADAEQHVANWANAKEQELIEYKKDQDYRRDFLGNVSHELKTPIFNIQGYVQTLLDGGLYDDEINLKYLKRLNKSVNRMINIVEDLEDISWLESEQSLIEFQSFSILELANDVCDSFEIQASEMKIKLQIVNKASILNVLGDREKIHQVFSNLISNSIKYGKKGGLTEIRLLDFEDKLLIEISDNGIGIDAGSLDRLFERFYRVDKNRSREIGGTGLGLAIVKHILEGHNQTINVRSTKDLGSTFSFILEKGE
ncbi:MAG: ATP-binding protein [Bacteroidota bacterium]|nr:ATP-binding protein [Bacteroidota bacterium]